jgi:hypothetical protein
LMGLGGLEERFPSHISIIEAAAVASRVNRAAVSSFAAVDAQLLYAAPSHLVCHMMHSLVRSDLVRLTQPPILP